MQYVVKTVPILNTKDPSEVVTSIKAPQGTQVLGVRAHHSIMALELLTPETDGIAGIGQVEIHLCVLKTDQSHDEFPGNFVGTVSLLDGHFVYHVFAKTIFVG